MSQYTAQVRTAFVLARHAAFSYIVFTAAILGLWWCTGHFQFLPDNLLPPPGVVFRELYTNRLHYASHLAVTLQGAAWGFAAAVMATTILALAGTRYRPFLTTLSAFSVLSQTTPVIALAPLLVHMFGFSLLAQASIAFLLAVFPIGHACVKAVLYCPKEFRNLADAMNLNWLDRLRWIDGPRVTEALITGASLSGVLAYIGSLVYELMSPEHGVGLIIMQGQRTFTEVQLFSGVVLALLSGVVIFALLQSFYLAYRVYRRDLSNVAVQYATSGV